MSLEKAENQIKDCNNLLKNFKLGIAWRDRKRLLQGDNTFDLLIHDLSTPVENYHVGVLHEVKESEFVCAVANLHDVLKKIG